MDKRVGIVSIVAGALGIFAGGLTLASGILALVAARQKMLPPAKPE